MRKALSILCVAGALAFAASPSQAQQRSNDGGIVLATLGGVVVGGALTYYYFPLSQLTTTALGAIVGGAVGNWWYGVSDTGEAPQGTLPRKQSDTDQVKPFQLVSYSEAKRPALRTAD